MFTLFQVLCLIREEAVLMAQLMALLLLGTLHCSSGIVITVGRTTPNPTGKCKVDRGKMIYHIRMLFCKVVVRK